MDVHSLRRKRGFPAASSCLAPDWLLYLWIRRAQYRPLAPRIQPEQVPVLLASRVPGTAGGRLALSEAPADFPERNSRATTLAVLVTLGHCLSALGHIKGEENRWMERAAVVAGGLTAWILLGSPSESQVLVCVVLAWMAGHVISGALVKSRKSYYRMLRTANRIQSHFGLHRERFLAPSLAYGHLPENFGPAEPRDEQGRSPRDVDGTQRNSSFALRLRALGSLVVAVPLAAVLRRPSWPMFSLALLTLLGVVCRHKAILRRDRRQMKAEVLQERGLKGFEADWLPPGERREA